MYIVQTVFQQDFLCKVFFLQSGTCKNCTLNGSSVISVQSVLLAIRHMYKTVLFFGSFVIFVQSVLLAVRYMYKYYLCRVLCHLCTKCSPCGQVHVQNCAFLGSFVISVQSVLLAVRYMYKLYLYAGFSVISVQCAFLAIR